MGNMLYNLFDKLLQIGFKKVLMGAGLGLASYSGISYVLEDLIIQSLVEFNAGDSIVLALLGLSGVDVALSMVMSAVIVRMTLFSSLSLVKST